VKTSEDNPGREEDLEVEEAKEFPIETRVDKMKKMMVKKMLTRSKNM